MQPLHETHILMPINMLIYIYIYMMQFYSALSLISQDRN